MLQTPPARHPRRYPAMRVQSTLLVDYHKTRNQTFREGDNIPLGVDASNWHGRTCRACGSWFIRRDPRGDFCSPACSFQPGVKRKRQRTGQEFVCEACGGSFYRYLADMRKGDANGSRMRFCKKECEAEFRGRTNVELTCPSCNETFTVWASRVTEAAKHGSRIFCSDACRDRTCGEERRSAIMVPCIVCGTKVRRIPATLRKRTYCSHKCFGTQVHTWAIGTSGKGGKRSDIGGRYVRSRWEANVIRILRTMGLAYDYEPRSFRCGGVSYTPDLWVPSWGCWVEIKGWWRPGSEEKLAAFRAHYPDERLVVLDRPLYQAMQREWAPRIPEWEFLVYHHRR